MSLIQNFFGSLISVFSFFSWVFGILMGFLFAHHKKFRGFAEMEVGWVFLQKLIFVDFFGCNR